MTINDLTAGRIVRHFKYNFLTDTEKAEKKYLYEIITLAEHTENGETLVIYRALYGEKSTWARPVNMFLSEVDREKYPDCPQTGRFEAAEKELL